MEQGRGSTPAGDGLCLLTSSQALPAELSSQNSGRARAPALCRPGGRAVLLREGWEAEALLQIHSTRCASRARRSASLAVAHPRCWSSHAGFRAAVCGSRSGLLPGVSVADAPPPGPPTTRVHKNPAHGGASPHAPSRPACVCLHQDLTRTPYFHGTCASLFSNFLGYSFKSSPA